MNQKDFQRRRMVAGEHAKLLSPVFRLFLFTLSFTLSFATARAQPKSSVQESENVLLFSVIRSGDAAKLDALLKTSVSANASMAGYSALMAATLNGTIQEMKLLIDHGADVNYVNSDSISALWLAVPDKERTELLIRHGADVRQRSKEGNNVLVKLAAVPGSAALMELLISKGCDPRKSGRVNDIMYNAAGSCDTAVVGLLIRHGVSVSDTSFFGDYPVSSATNYRCFNTLKMLVEHGADVNVSPRQGPLPLFTGITPLMWAAVSNDKPSFYFLLENGADAKAKTPRGYTTLMFLAMSEVDDPDMTLALIKHGVNPAEKALDDTDALHHALLKGNTRSVEILTKYVSKKQ